MVFSYFPDLSQPLLNLISAKIFDCQHEYAQNKQDDAGDLIELFRFRLVGEARGDHRAQIGEEDAADQREPLDRAADRKMTESAG